MARQKRSLKPRTRETVENRSLEGDSDVQRSLTPRGDICLNPKLSNVRQDKLRCYKKGKAVIRVWNMLDPEEPGDSLLNGRLNSLDTAGLNGMSISEPAYCVQYAGVNKDSGLLAGSDPQLCSYIIARNKSSSYEGIPFWELPYPKLYVTAKKARESGKFGHGEYYRPEWNILMSGSMPSLASFKQRYFVVASVYENGPDLDLVRERNEYMKEAKQVVNEIPRNGIPLGEGPNDPLTVLVLPISAGRKILQMCNVEKQDWEGDEHIDPSVMFKYGDPCGKFNQKKGTVNGGLFFTVYNPDVVDIDKNTSFKGITNPQVVEYECAVSTKYEGPNGTISASLNAGQVDNIFNKHLFLWKDSDDDPQDSYLLHEPSIEERCVMLSKAFRQVPDLLRFSWMSHPEYLEFDSVKAILNNRTSVDMGANQVEEEEDTPPWEEKPKKSAKKKTAAEIAEEFDDEFEDEEFDDEKDEIEHDDDFEDDEFDDDDDFDDEDEDDDFDDFDDEIEEDEEVEDKLEESLAKASAIARSKKRAAPKRTPRSSKK